MSRAGCIAFGEEKGFFPILIDGDVDNEDGMTKKSAISGVDKDVTGWISANGRGCISRQREKVLATPRVGGDRGKRLLAMPPGTGR